MIKQLEDEFFAPLDPESRAQLQRAAAADRVSQRSTLRRLASRLTPDAPTFEDVLAARERISPYLRETALNRYPALDELVGTEVWVKHENHLPVGTSRCAAASTSSRSSPRTSASAARHRLDRQPRPVDRVRLAAFRRARGDLRPRGREPGEGRVDPRPRRGDRRARPRLRRRARALRDALRASTATATSTRRTSRR